MTILGIDVSAAQGVIPSVHWQAIASDKSFVIIEAQVGNDGPNAHFDDYLSGATAAGMVVGAYCCAACLPDDGIHPNRDPEGQMQLFFTACGGLGATPGELRPVIDLEDPEPSHWAADKVTPAFLEDWTGRAIDKVVALWGVRPIIYGYPDWFQHAALRKVASCDLWLAAYGGSKYRTAPPWNTLSPIVLASMLQVSDGGYRLPNGAPCDENEVYSPVTYADLRGQS
jgi:GH25 family lysozyme M1 (1,4-beta-N-acetylmuramidase)